MADQDRSRWHHDQIGEAVTLLDHAIHLKRPGPYQVQAAIACLHGLAPTFADTDWPQIVSLYHTLAQFVPTPVVRVNKAVAVAEAAGAEAGLAVLDELAAPAVKRWHLYWSARAELLHRVGRDGDAVDAFDRALACSPNDSDRQFLLQRRRTLAGERQRAT